MAGNGHDTIPAFEDMTLIDKRMTIAQSNFLPEPGTHHGFLKKKTRGSRIPVALLGEELPAGIGRPAVERCFLYVTLAKGRTEKIAGKKFKPWRNARIVRDGSFRDPRG